MLAILTQYAPVFNVVRLWWWRQRTQPMPAAEQRQIAAQAYTGVPRRYPIPAERAHLYARAADESFGG